MARGASAREPALDLSVTSNTWADEREFLSFAERHRLDVTTHRYPLDRADHALPDLSHGRFDDAAVSTH